MAKSVVAYATLTVADTAIGLSSASTAITHAVTGAIITLETAQIRWRADGTVPTDTEGHIMNISDALDFSEGNWQELLNRIRFIRTGATSGALKITYLRTA
mgnify:CR=1 FL=1